MIRIPLRLIKIIFLAIISLFQISIAQEQPADTLVTGNNTFAIKLYKQLNREGNLFFSPFSISSALGMVYAGAEGTTADEIKTVLNFQLDQAKLHSTFNKLNNKLMANAEESGQKLDIANGLCIQRPVKEEYQNFIKTNYKAEIFKGDLGKINRWAKKKTRGKIPKILENLDPLSVCVILNAIYFKAGWESEFNKKYTRDAPFKLSSQKEVTVSFMYQKSTFSILEKENFQAISMPYKGEKMSMVIFLPREIDGLNEFEKNMTSDKLNLWMKEIDDEIKKPSKRRRMFSSGKQRVNLHLPKFKLETSYDLIPPFAKLGISKAFRFSSDFKRIYEQDLRIDQIKHKAFIKVDEEGTEASAATAVGMRVTSAPPPIATFRADHPFIFTIRDDETGSILFMGRITDPSN